jgi:hypothetical protein
MTKLKSIILGAVSLFFVLTPSASYAVEIPVLTWEKGRVQEIILGDTSNTTNWKLELVSENTAPVQFFGSSQNESGFYVYSAVIPNELPEGAYRLETSGDGIETSIVAGVNLIAAETYDITKQSQDLSLIVGLFTFITVTLSSLRSRKYSSMYAAAEEESFVSDSTKLNPLEKIAKRALNLRRDLTQGVAPSLLRFLLGQESRLLFSVSKTAYYALPLLATVLGFFAAINAQASDGLENSNLIYFFLITLLGLADSFSGIFGLLTFWAIQFFFGDVANLNQFLIVIAAAIAWVGPSLAARVYLDSIKKDFSKPSTALAKLAAALGSAVAATLIFFGGYKLLVSLMGEISNQWQMQPTYLALVFVFALVKALFMFRFENETETKTSEAFEVVRVTSPLTATSTLLIILGFTYLWTEDAMTAFIAAALFSAPYFFLFIRFEPLWVSFFSKIKRNIVLESSVAVLASFIIYSQIAALPLLSDQRAETFLIAAAIPGLLHAIYSSICDSAQRQGRIEA